MKNTNKIIGIVLFFSVVLAASIAGAKQKTWRALNASAFSVSSATATDSAAVNVSACKSLAAYVFLTTSGGSGKGVRLYALGASSSTGTYQDLRQNSNGGSRVEAVTFPTGMPWAKIRITPFYAVGATGTVTLYCGYDE